MARRRDSHRVEQLARAGALLDDGDLRAEAAEGVAGRVRAALGDAGEQGLGSQRPLDGRAVLRLYPAIPHISADSPLCIGCPGNSLNTVDSGCERFVRSQIRRDRPAASLKRGTRRADRCHVEHDLAQPLPDPEHAAEPHLELLPTPVEAVEADDGRRPTSRGRGARAPTRPTRLRRRRPSRPRIRSSSTCARSATAGS